MKTMSMYSNFDRTIQCMYLSYSFWMNIIPRRHTAGQKLFFQNQGIEGTKIALRIGQYSFLLQNLELRNIYD